MGIRFYCPNGHKLNVKEHLAGKRGICPHCDARFVIPAQSVDADPAKESSGVPSGGSAGNVTQVGTGVPEVSLVGPSERIGDSREVMPVVNVGTQSPQTVSIQPPGDLLGNLSVDLPKSINPQEASPPCPSADPPTESGNTDPLAESGNKVWYVRLADGGQFGPAGGDVMRTWLAEDRIAADSLVWCEGWPDWRPAGEVFPQLATSRTEGGLPRIAVPETSVAAGTSRTGRPRKPRSRQARLITGLVVVVLVLLFVLVLVVSGAFGAGTTTEGWQGEREASVEMWRSRPRLCEMLFIAECVSGRRAERPLTAR